MALYRRHFFEILYSRILPHAIHDKESSTVCIIMRDLDKSEKARFDPDVDKQARQWAEKLEAENGVTKAQIHKVSITVV